MKGNSISPTMSIAVSAVIKPSRSLLVLVIGIYLGLSLVGVMLAFSKHHESFGFPRLLLPVIALLIAVAGIKHIIRNRKSLHIDISGNGQIKVAEDDAWAKNGAQAQLFRSDRVVARLLPNSTIWPFLLLLRLEKEDRTVNSWVILPDCMSAESFRALSVAVRWIAAHNDRAERKIL